MKRKLFQKMFALLLAVALLAGLAPTTSLASPARDGGSTTVFVPFIMLRGPYWVAHGAEMDSITPAKGLDQMAEAGTGWVRKNALLWSDVQPDGPNTYNWNASSVVSLFNQVQNATREGMEVILIVRSTPTWAQKNSGDFCGPMQEQYFDEFANFMAAAAAKFGKAPYNVKYWEIWNEPDVDRSLDPINIPADSPYGCWGDNTDANFGGEFYGEMLKAIYPKMKAADASAQILVGGLLLDCDPRSACPANKAPKFLNGILEAGAGNSFDGVSFHAYDYYQSTWDPYAYYNANWRSSWTGDAPSGQSAAYTNTGPVVIAKVDYLREVLDEYDVSGKYLINTEAALLYDRDDVAKQHYVAQVYAAAMALGLRANIWFSTLGWTGRDSALLDENLTPKPAYYAYKFSRSKLGNANFSQEITSYNGVKGYEFTDGNKKIWVLWALNGDGANINLSPIPTTRWIWDGKPGYVSDNPGSTTLYVPPTPIYLEWE